MEPVAWQVLSALALLLSPWGPATGAGLVPSLHDDVPTGVGMGPSLQDGAATGAPDLVTDRPDFTESALSVPPGSFQLEGGYSFSSAGEDDAHSFGELLLRIGVVERLEARVGLNSLVVLEDGFGTHAGFEDLSLGIKVELLRGDPGLGLDRPDVALLAGSSIPSGGSVVGAEELEPEFVLAVAWDLTETLSLGSNVGYARRSLEEAGFDELSGSLALGIGLTDRLGAYVEGFAFFPQRPGDPDLVFVNGGLTYLLSSDLQLDARIGRDLRSPDDEVFFGIGASTRW